MIKAHNIVVTALVAAVGGAGWIYKEGPSQARVPARNASCRPVGLMVNGPVGGGSDDFPDLAFAGTFERTRLAIRVDYPRGGIVDLRADRSTLDELQDDLGADLRKTDQHFGPFEMLTRVADDRRSAVFVIPSDKLPGPRATRLVARGKVALMTSSGSSEARSEHLALATGGAFAAGPFTFEVTRMGSSEWGDGWSMTLSTNTDLTAVRTYAFVDSNGEHVELSPSMTISGSGTWTQTLECERELGEGVFVVDYWDSPKIIEVPFEVSAGLGLN